MGYTLRYDFEMKDLHAFSNQPAAFSHLRVVDSYNVLNEVAQNRESFLSHLKIRNHRKTFIYFLSAFLRLAERGKQLIESVQTFERIKPKFWVQ